MSDHPQKSLGKSVPLQSESTFHDMKVTIQFSTANVMLTSAVHRDVQDTQMARTALDAGADVNGGETVGLPLMSAASGYNTSLVHLLLERGADVNASSSRGETALMEAARYGSAKNVRILLEHGANIEAWNCDGMTALHFAANDNPKAICVLIKAGANIDARDNEGKTPLMHAAHWSRYSAVRAFLRNGADVAARSNNGYSVIRWHQQSPPWWPDRTEEQWKEKNRREIAERRTSHDLLTRFWHSILRIREIVFGIPEDPYLALQKLLVEAGAKE
jgi:hypothetical protein